MLCLLLHAAHSKRHSWPKRFVHLRTELSAHRKNYFRKDDVFSWPILLVDAVLFSNGSDFDAGPERDWEGWVVDVGLVVGVGPV